MNPDWLVIVASILVILSVAGTVATQMQAVQEWQARHSAHRCTRADVTPSVEP